MKEFFQKKENRFFLAVIAALIAFVSWQESQIADLQERMMNIEASRYDDQLSTLYWHAGVTDDKLEEYGKDLYHLQKQSTEQDWQIKKLQWGIQEN